MRLTHSLTLIAACFAYSAASSSAAVVTANVSASVQANFEGKTDSAVSSALSDSISASSVELNSQTTSGINYSFDLANGALSASSLITTEKLVSAKRGGFHHGASSFLLDFQIDSEMEYSLHGTWGFFGNSNSAPPDSLGFVFSGPDGTIINRTSGVAGGTNAGAFNEVGTIGAGTYQLAFQSELNETFNSQDVARVGWAIEGFQLNSTTTLSAVPEPSAVIFLGLLSALGIGRRKRR
ncbi:PEP-CTERM sorting domain-containing protein [Stieleria sp. TO1_6]|uniref:PEP-CTERM sorting domain-containing protein n=1 Tax=Stieleria tagensis TaxID=2956795 RepID=UPI00209BA5AA|nr:PEP-CTERM sorting domain-containing protein [Stieleria tagensis]MCO8124631.1 PEP-CTERM sorting domain-containing protein [Stieleria tagensis]